MLNGNNANNIMQDGLNRLTLLSYNIQAGMFYRPGYHRYVINSWQQVLPHPRQLNNLNHIAQLITPYDFVALQEIDGGSLRSGFLNQLSYLADKAQFPYWHQQLNRNLGKIAQHSNGVLSRIRPVQRLNYKLPGMIAGRGAIMLQFGCQEAPLIIVVVHLSLGARAQKLQFAFLQELIADYQHVMIMGDMNCTLKQLWHSQLITKTGLRSVNDCRNTFPSWEPTRNIDHILVSESIQIEWTNVLSYPYSDHLPIALSVILPSQIQLNL